MLSFTSKTIVVYKNKRQAYLIATVVLIHLKQFQMGFLPIFPVCSQDPILLTTKYKQNRSFFSLSQYDTYIRRYRYTLHYYFYNSTNTTLFPSRVPQGSNLGPVLFLLLINDLSFELKFLHLLFACGSTLQCYLNVTNF